MGKSFRRDDSRKYNDDYNAYSRAEIDYRNHKKEKKIKAALHTRRLDVLDEENSDEEDYDFR
jgi:hypothetical protein